MKINAIYQISEYPLIWASTGSKNWETLINNTDKEAYLLVHPMWEFSWTSLKLYYSEKISLKKRNITLILLHNSKSEFRFARFFQFKSYLINQNIHCCEHFFKIDNSVPKKYDAIYTAAAKKYKRLELASRISNLFVLTYFWPDIRNEKGEWDLHSYEPKLRHADFNKFRIGSEEICKKINESRCGLALSKKEGAMWATMEYLFCGIPIVSTQSTGGRDFFFRDNNSIITSDRATEVAKGVQEIIQRNIDPNEIRENTLQLIEPYRLKYLNLVLELIKGQGGEVPNKEDMYFRIWGNEKGILNLRIL
ncbi:glycosyltransferase [Winogradskyella vidalii]|uniref:glycosyltransferase n=1 Tax=Winogradskyella vidalii TaxID=2615024 RepID=UPI0015CD04B2|nr:glycosyltransferase [Winogradskyella vidalii]